VSLSPYESRKLVIKTFISKKIMKKIGIISILLGLGIICTNSQDSIVSIPDPAFLYALIEEGVDTNGDSLISYAEAEAISSLDVVRYEPCGWPNITQCCSGNISSLIGIEAFKNLDTLACSCNILDSLDVSNCISLKKIQCDRNHLTYLDVSKNISLTSLNCSGNQLTNLDVSKNISLTSLNCSGNQLTNLDVYMNTALTALNIGWNDYFTSLDVS
jgi:Leucine-rich repeat (LRR) protein